FFKDVILKYKLKYIPS
uniref:Uncharacterized protein n=1 Tax=Strigamia maritima TaxID=126957 RepID=T1JKV2_STRMM